MMMATTTTMFEGSDHTTTIKGKNHNSMDYLYFQSDMVFTNTFLLLSFFLFLSNPKAAVNDDDDDNDNIRGRGGSITGSTFTLHRVVIIVCSKPYIKYHKIITNISQY